MPDSQGALAQPTSYSDPGFSRFLRSAFLAASGFDGEDINRPVVGIAMTASDFNPCHRGVPEIVEAVKRGVLEAGGLPLVFPTMSLGETFINPTSMLLRNLMAMETEELVRSQPMDAAVLIGGCDKTVPAQAMAAVAAGIPVFLEVVGPMLTNSWQGERVGACTDCRRMWAKYRAGELDESQITEVQGALATTSGTCMVMGTASTMACLVETLGLMAPGGATAPSPTGDRLRHALNTGRLAARAAAAPTTELVRLTRGAVMNAAVVLAALGGSTNAIVHLLAIARRAGLDVTVRDLDEPLAAAPLLVDLKPSGTGYMEDFHRAGGLPVLLKVLEPMLDTSVRTADGRTLKEALAEVSPPADWQSVIRPLDDPIKSAPTLAVLSGSLAPDGAVLKVSSATESLFEHEGVAVVFDSPEDAAERLDASDTSIDASDVLILRNAGPVGAGMPEAGSLPIPRALAEQGITDMVRVSDARMSGTSYGTVVLHCSPEGAVGGPIALVRDGDRIALSVSKRSIDVLVDEDELARRRSEWQPPERWQARGWQRLYADQVMQADKGADLRFLSGVEGDGV
jgi:dihydroxy-acid dehydratase